MEPERAIASAEAESPPLSAVHANLLASAAVASFDDDNEIMLALERLIGQEMLQRQCWFLDSRRVSRVPFL
jgi:hypothetical protein